MRRLIALLILLPMLSFAAAQAAAEEKIKDDALRQSMADMSAAITEDGAGWETYAAYLHADYARWAMGQVYEGARNSLTASRNGGNTVCG